MNKKDITNARNDTVTAYKKGYRVSKSGDVISPFSNKSLSLAKSVNGYYYFSIRDSSNKRKTIYVHKLAAYQLFKSDYLQNSIEVRHLDGIATNNKLNNIAIGTHSDNEMDKPAHIRKSSAIKAASYIRKFNNTTVDKIKEYYNNCRSYKKTMNKFNITSKGTLYYLLNNNYQTEKNIIE